MEEKSTLQRAKDFLKTFMLVEAGGFIGRSLQIYTRYKKTARTLCIDRSLVHGCFRKRSNYSYYYNSNSSYILVSVL